jgi:hypothetical protein
VAVQPKASRRKAAKSKAVGRPSGVEGETLAIAGEMMRSATNPASGGAYFLPIDEIIIRKGWRTYREMRHDEQVKAVLQFKKTLVAGRTWDIVPAKDIPKPADFDQQVKDAKKQNEQIKARNNAPPPDPGVDDQGNPKPAPAPKEPEDEVEVPQHDPSSDKAKEIARFVEFNLKRINFKAIIKNALTAFDFGFSAGEIIYEVGEFEGQRAILLKDIKHRDPQSIEIKMDKHGNIQGFKQTAINEVIEVETDKMWHWAHQSQFGNQYGISDLRAAYRAWWAKRFIINFWNVFLERMGAPMTMMKYPQGAPEDLKKTLKQILRNLNSKTEILVPDGVTVELIEAQRTGKGDYDAALAYCDNAIAKAMLMIAVLGLSAAEGGRTADSQSRLHLRVLFKAMDELSQDLMFSFMQQVIKPLVDMNFEHENLYPEFIWQDYGGFEGIEIADTIKDLHVAGIIDMDQADVNYIRSITGLPLRGDNDKPDEVQRPAPTPPPNSAIPAPAPQGNRSAKKGPGGGRKTDPNTNKPRE